MDLQRSINKRVKRTLDKIKNRYLEGLRRGKSTSYYFHPSFYRYYLKRFAWLLVSLLTFNKTPYKTFYRIISTSYFPYHSVNGIYRNNVFKVFFRALFGLNFLNVGNVYPAYSASFIRKSKKLTFNKPSKPLVSIIIPVYNNLSYTYNCLLSIRDNVSDTVSYEIIVIDDSSTDETQNFFENNVQGLNYIRNSENLGYLKSNNKAADLADGKYLCLLNNDTEVQENWLESLLELIENDEKVGCVGSKLIYPNKLLQEAGGIIYKTANGSNFGRMDDPDKPAYNFIREVDYCSAASILFRKSDFEKVGKFDTQFAPAYYEDTDLCFSIRNILNKKVMYHPLSKVVHFEGMTSGKEIKEGSVKNYQKANRLKFLEKWKRFLQQHDPEGYNKSYRRLLPAPTIVVIEWFLPTYDKDSGSLRLFRLLSVLKSLDYHVIFIPEDGCRPEPYYSAMIKAGVEVRVDLNSHYSVNDFEAVDYFASVKYIWISRPDLNALYKEKIRIFKNAKWVYDTVDLHHIRMLREASFIEDNSFHLTQANEIKDLEILLATEADISVTLTNVERRILEINGAKNVSIVPNIHIPITIHNFKSFSERSGLVFIGGYKHVPNVDAAIWLVKEIMPIVWKAKPNMSLYLLGSNPPDEVLQLGSEKVVVPGYIKDVSSFFLNSKIFVAPLRYGAGMKGKMGQALEYRLPIISTSMGAEGMGLEDEKHFLLAERTEQFSAQILRLYHDQELWERISNKSEEAIFSFSPQTVRKALKNILDENRKEEETVYKEGI